MEITYRGKFLSTPSGWRATAVDMETDAKIRISIHALRVEGDLMLLFVEAGETEISIHALRVEGDGNRFCLRYTALRISIHALRVEGDPAW